MLKLNIANLLEISVVILTFCSQVQSYNILGIFPYNGANHYWVTEPLLRELANRGHNVTVVSHATMSRPPATYKEINLAGLVPNKNTLSFDLNEPDSFLRHAYGTLLLFKWGHESCQTLVRNPKVKQLPRYEKYDVILVEQFNSDCPLALAYKFDSPFIGVSTDVLGPWFLSRLGIPNHANIYPSHSFSYYGRNPNFFQRIVTVLINFFITWYYYIMSQVTDRVMLYKYLGDDLPSLEAIARNMSLMLVNSYPVLHGPDTVPPNLIGVGGLHVRNPQKLPDDLEKFISEAAHGVIYVSFGSMVKASSMPQDKLNAFLQAFAELPQRVLWKWENDTLPGAPPNLLTMKWMPQLDILSHKNVKVFISHGGMLGTTEAIHTGVPMLTIPLFGDQFANSASVRESGLGLTLNFEDITKDNMLNVLRQLLEPKMYANAKRLSQIWHDRPMSPMDTAIYWIEYVARYGGAPHLRSAAVDLPLYQYLLLDVIAFLGAIILIIVYINYKVLKFVLGFCCGSKNSTATPVNSKHKKTKRE